MCHRRNLTRPHHSVSRCVFVSWSLGVGLAVGWFERVSFRLRIRRRERYMGASGSYSARCAYSQNGRRVRLMY